MVNGSDFGAQSLMVFKLDIDLPVFSLIFFAAVFIVLIFGNSSRSNVLMRTLHKLDFEAGDSGAIKRISGIVVTEFQIFLHI